MEQVERIERFPSPAPFCSIPTAELRSNDSAQVRVPRWRRPAWAARRRGRSSRSRLDRRDDRRRCPTAPRTRLCRSDRVFRLRPTTANNHRNPAW